MIIAVDYDGTLYKDGKINEPLVFTLRAKQAQGDTVILWTCRTGKRLQEAVKALYKKGFMPNYVNQNAPQVVQRLGADPRKVWADVYIDDKNR